jgi:adenine-specific DNA-methyltransferase
VKLTFDGRGRPVIRDVDSGRWRFADRPHPAPADLPATDADLVIHREAWEALAALARTRHRGRIRLCYIDPPFNTGNEFDTYDDRTAHEVWLAALEERVALAHELIAPGGFFVAHINVVEQAYLKVLLDEIFGRDGLVAMISWQRAPDRTVLGQGSALVADQVEYLLVYVKDRAAVPADWPRPQKRTPLPEKTLRSYARTLVPAPEATLVDRLGDAEIWAHAGYQLGTIPARDLAAAVPREYPRMMRTTNQQVESTFQQALLARMPRPGVLYRAEYTQARGKHQGRRVRWYLDGNVVLWLRDVARLEDGRLVRVSDLNNFWSADEIPVTGIAREGGVVLRRGKKPERLLERLIAAFSRPGEWVLDFFAGSGTTGAVAHRLGRRFILVEAAEPALALIRARLGRAGAGFEEV